VKEINYRSLAERLTIKRLVTEVYPTGIISLVSDTFDLWAVLTESLPALKEEILARNGGPESLDKVVIRPDSGDPADILCGDGGSTRVETGWNEYEDVRSPANKGVVELLWDTFGGTVNDQGYKVLNPAVGAIYGDAITIDRCKDICARLKAKGFASTNVVYGIGSYTYQYQTRDSLGFAMKATSVTINGEEKAIFKQPVTDDGTKNSARGRVSVHNSNVGLTVVDSDTPNVFSSPDLLKPLFENGKLLRETTLAEIRGRLNG
jgi:nicotinamide phosphoribosyltransferase